MFKFVCEHIVPGCTHEDEDETREKVLERAAAHLSRQHDLNHHDDRIAEALRTTGITFMRPS